MYKTKTWSQKLIIIITLVAMLLMCTIGSIGNTVYAVSTNIDDQLTDNQYLELRGVSINDIDGDGQNLQLIMELWSYNLEYKGFDVRFSYDGTKLSPSNITTNVVTDDETEYFKFENEFNGSLDMFTIPDEGENTIMASVYLNTPIDAATEHVVVDGTNLDGDPTYKVVTDEVLIGKMSFKLEAGKSLTIQKLSNSDYKDFKLVEDDSTSPRTGIKIDKSLTENYQSQTTFRFTDETASSNAYLSNLIVSNGEVDMVEPSNSTYKEYTLTPTFDKDEGNYEITLMEYVDTVDIKAILEDDTATMKIKTPKREDGELVYDGPNIVYEENSLVSDTKTQVTINKLGEPNTEITITVTAEDNVTTKEYKVTIKRPYATIKGSIYTAPTDALNKFTSNIRLYDSTDVSGVIDWSNVTNTAEVHTNLLSLTSADYKTENDGTYEIYVIPNKYDILLDKDGYLDHIYKERTLLEGDVLDLGRYELLAGDLNKDGAVDLKDVSLLNTQYLMDNTDPNFEEVKYYDFDESGVINLGDISVLNGNYTKTIEVE